MANWQKAFRGGASVWALAGAMAGQQAMAEPILSVSASPSPVAVGQALGVDVTISGITDLFSYQFSLSFDPSVLQVSSVNEGPFLASAGGTTFAGYADIDNAQGLVSFVFNTLIGAVPGVSGDGTLAHFSFDAVALGSSGLGFSDVLFVDSNANTITLQAMDGSVNVVPEPGSAWLVGIGLAAFVARRRPARRV